MYPTATLEKAMTGEENLKDMIRDLGHKLSEERGEFREKLEQIQKMAQRNRDTLLILEERDIQNTTTHDVIFRKIDSLEKRWLSTLVASIGTLLAILGFFLKNLIFPKGG